MTRGGITQAYIFFEDVFVPKERVFMCGEYSHAGNAVFRFTLPYRSAIGACVAGQGDVMVGASVLIARANGLDEKVFRDKITQMIVNNETTFGVGIAASVMGTQHPSGAWLPDPVLAHANKVHVATLPYETKRLTQEIAGGIAETGLHAVVPRLRGRPLRAPHPEVPEGELAGRDAHAHRAVDRVADRGRRRAGLHARRRLARTAPRWSSSRRPTSRR